ncbi:MAG: hypothetical protein ACUVQH_03405, partial [Thermogutta sp.]
MSKRDHGLLPPRAEARKLPLRTIEPKACETLQSPLFNARVKLASHELSQKVWQYGVEFTHFGLHTVGAHRRLTLAAQNAGGSGASHVSA